MKTNNTTTKSTNSVSSQRARFKFLKSMFHQAPLPKNETEELKTLAKKFNPKMYKWMEENKELY